MLPTSKALTRTICTLVLLFPFVVQAQSPVGTPFKVDSMSRFGERAQLSTDAQFASSSFSIGSIGNILLSGIIDDATLDDLAEKAAYSNSLFYRDRVELGYQKALNPEYMISVGLRQENFVSSVIPQSAFQFAAYGNSPYKGQKMNFPEFSLSTFTTSALEVGLLRSFTLSSGQLSVGIKAAFLQGQNFIHLSAQNSSLYTEENAEYIDLVYDYEYNYYDNSSAFSGLGFDLGVEVAYEHKERFRIASWMDGLGNMYWNGDNFNSGSTSGQLRYEGLFFTFDQLSSIGSEDELNKEIDSLVDLMSPTERDQYRFNLPYTAGLSLMTYLGNRESVSLAAHMVPGFYDQPVLQASFRHFFNENLHGSLNYNSGPFGGHGVGAEAGYSNAKFSVKMKTNGLVRLSNGPTPLTRGQLQLSYFI